MELSKENFLDLREAIHKFSGIFVASGKQYLIKQRLEAIIKYHEMTGYDELSQRLKCPTLELREQVISAMTTNETYFFRDIHPFETFKLHLLPQFGKLTLKRKDNPYLMNKPKIRIWSVAASSGQEPYSLAMLIHEYCEVSNCGLTVKDFSITATDIDSTILNQAKKGIYNCMEIARGLDDFKRFKYFNKQDDLWAIKESIKEMVEFRILNLKDPFLFLGEFDVIFCRNVLIYFDENMVKNILEQIHHLLSDQGTVILGASDHMYGFSNKFHSTNVNNTLLFKKA